MGPDNTMPIAAPTASIAATKPILPATRSGSTTSRTIPNDNATAAPPRPCTTRPTINMPIDDARAETTQPTASAPSENHQHVRAAEHVAEAAEDGRGDRRRQQQRAHDPGARGRRGVQITLNRR